MLANMVTAILLKAMSRFFVNNRLIKKINNNIMIKILSSFIESKLPMARYIKYKENIEPKKRDGWFSFLWDILYNSYKPKRLKMIIVIKKGISFQKIMYPKIGIPKMTTNNL